MWSIHKPWYSSKTCTSNVVQYNRVTSWLQTLKPAWQPKCGLQGSCRLILYDSVSRIRLCAEWGGGSALQRRQPCSSRLGWRLLHVAAACVRHCAPMRTVVHFLSSVSVWLFWPTAAIQYTSQQPCLCLLTSEDILWTGGVGWGSSCQVPLLTDRWFGESDLPSSLTQWPTFCFCWH